MNMIVLGRVGSGHAERPAAAFVVEPDDGDDVMGLGEMHWSRQPNAVGHERHNQFAGQNT